MMRCFIVIVFASAAASAAFDAAGTAGRWLIEAYQAVISPRQPANTCNFTPSCSEFTRQAIAARGFVAGVVIGADRLTRCHPAAWSELDRAYAEASTGRLCDPVSRVFVPATATTAGNPVPSGTAALALPDRPELEFARWLETRGDWRRAGTEYARVAALDPDSGTRVSAALLGGEALGRAGDHELARTLFETALADAPVPARLGIARALFEAGRYHDCRAELARLGPQAERERAVLTGWSLFRERRFADAAGLFRGLDDPELSPLALLDGRDLARRSPPLAAGLSALLPGAGQLYAGRLADAISSLLMVAGTGTLTWWYASEPERRDRTYVKTAFFGATTALFYAGGVYGAYRAAGDFNRVQERRYADRADALLARVRQ